MAIGRSTIILATLTVASVASGPTPIYIDTVSEYYNLSSCAMQKVSTIVRAMSSGCGNDSQTTSFTCSCIASSASFDLIISSAVASNYNNDTMQASSALEVFASYCALGDVRALTTSQTGSSLPIQTTSVAGSGTASPAAMSTATTVAPTSPTLGISSLHCDGDYSNIHAIGIFLAFPFIVHR